MVAHGCQTRIACQECHCPPPYVRLQRPAVPALTPALAHSPRQPWQRRGAGAGSGWARRRARVTLASPALGARQVLNQTKKKTPQPQTKKKKKRP